MILFHIRMLQINIFLYFLGGVYFEVIGALLLIDSTKVQSSIYIQHSVLLLPTCMAYSKLLSKTPNIHHQTKFCFQLCVCPHSSAFLTNDCIGDGDLQPHPVSNL